MDVAKAIVLKSINYSDTQKIIYTYTKEDGYLTFITPAFTFKKKNNGLSCMQVVEIEFIRSEKSSLHKIKTISPFVNTSGIYFDIYKMNIALLWSEILTIILKNEQKNEDLFNFIVESVEYLNSAQTDTANFNLFFLYRLVTLIGFNINTSGYSQGSLFNPQDGSFYPPESKALHISGPNTARIIHDLCTCKLEEVKKIPLNRQSRVILLDIILYYIGIHLNTNLNIKSIQVLREVFS